MSTSLELGPEQDEPRTPTHAWGEGRAALALVDAIEGSLQSVEAASWCVDASAGLLVATKPLPWVDGIGYLAPSREDPIVWLPTTRRLSHAQLAGRALRARFGSARLAVLPLECGTRVVDLAMLGRVDAARLTAFRAELSQWIAGRT